MEGPYGISLDLSLDELDNKLSGFTEWTVDMSEEETYRSAFYDAINENVFIQYYWIEFDNNSSGRTLTIANYPFD